MLQLLHFERRGHVVTRGICSPGEMAAYTEVLMASFEKGKVDAYRQKVRRSLWPQPTIILHPTPPPPPPCLEQVRVMFGQEAYEQCRTVAQCQDMLDEVDGECIPFLQTFNSWRRYNDVRRFALAKRWVMGRAEGGGGEKTNGLDMGGTHEAWWGWPGLATWQLSSLGCLGCACTRTRSSTRGPEVRSRLAWSIYVSQGHWLTVEELIDPSSPFLVWACCFCY